MNVAFVTRNNARSATLSAGSEATPVSHLQANRLSRKWRSTSLLASATTIGIDFGPDAGSGPLAMHRVLAMAVLSGNFSPACQAVASLGDVWKEQPDGLLTGWDSGGLAPVFPVLDDAAGRLHGVRGYVAPAVPDLFTRNAFFVPPIDIRHSYRYGRIDFLDPDNLDGFIEAGGLVSGPGIVPPDGTGIQPGWSFELEDSSDVTTSETGFDSHQRRVKRRVFRFALNWLDFEEALSLAQVFDGHHGLTHPFLMCPFPALDSLWLLGIWGKLRRATGVNESAAFHFQRPFEVAEVVR